MTVVVFGIDGLDPNLVDADEHPNLALAAHSAMGISTKLNKDSELPLPTSLA